MPGLARAAFHGTVLALAFSACLGATEREKVTPTPDRPAEPAPRIEGAPAQAAALAEAAAEKERVEAARKALTPDAGMAPIPAAATATLAEAPEGDEDTVTEEPVPPGDDAPKKMTSSRRPPPWGNGPKKGEAIFGVGVVKGVANPALARRAAAERAREDLDRRLVAARKKKKGAPLQGSAITLVHYDKRSRTHYARAELVDVR